MLLVIVAIFVIDHYNSNDGRKTASIQTQAHTVKISNNNTIQQAYEQCRVKTLSEFLSKNSHLSAEELNLTLPHLPDTCKDVLLSSCKNHDPSDKGCKFGLMSVGYMNNS